MHACMYVIYSLSRFWNNFVLYLWVGVFVITCSIQVPFDVSAVIFPEVNGLLGAKKNILFYVPTKL